MPPNALLVRWAGGWREALDTAAIAAGERHEAALGLGTVQSATEVDVEAAGELERFAHVRLSSKLNYDPRTSSELPYVNGWRPGHSPRLNGTPLRTLSLTVVRGPGGRAVCVPELGDEILPRDVAEAQAQKKMINGTFRGQSKLATPVSQIRTTPSLVISAPAEGPPGFGEQIAYWTMSEGTGNPIDVIQGLELIGKLGFGTVPTSWITGDPVFGTCVDASAQVFETVRCHVLGLSAGYTLTSWVYADTEPADCGIGYTDINAGGVGAIAGAGVGDVDFYHGAETISAVNVGLTGIWQMYAQTWDGTTVRAYVGNYGGAFSEVGNLSGTGSSATSPCRAAAQPPDYGCVNGYGGSDHARMYPGRLGPVGIWSGPLSLTELEARFAALA